LTLSIGLHVKGIAIKMFDKFDEKNFVRVCRLIANHKNSENVK